ncbi:MAG: PAS domain S-box protein [Anaerohalosphaeraceae bacterium]
MEENKNVHLGLDRLLGILDTMPDGIYVVSNNFDIEYANKALLNDFGPIGDNKCYKYLFGRTEPCPWCLQGDVRNTAHWEWESHKTGKVYDTIDAPLVNLDGSISKLKIIRDITSYKYVQRKMEDLAKFPSENPFPVLRIAQNGTILYSNTPGKVLLEFWDRTVGQVVPARWVKIIQTVVASGRTSVRQIKLHNRIFSFVFALIPDSNYINIYGRDITRQKKSEDALSKSRLDMSRAQAVGNIGSWRLNIQCNELTWSDENHRIFGIPKGTPLSYETFLSVVHPEDRDYVDTTWKAALRGEPYDIDHRLVVNGITRWVHEKAYLELDEHGELLGGFGTTQDITERKVMEEKIRYSSKRFEILSETASQLLQEKNPQQIVDMLCQKVMEYLDCHIYVNYLVEESDHQLHLNASAGMSDEMERRIEWLDFGQAICGRVAQEGKRIVAEDIQESCDSRADLVRSVGIKAYACHPLVLQGRVMGTLSFGTRSRTTFSEDDLAMMKTVADEVATAIERKRTMEALEAAAVATLNEKNRLEAIMEILPVGVSILDASGGVVKTNSTFDAIWGSLRPAVRNIEEYAAYKAWWCDTGKPVKPEEWASAIAVQKGQAVIGQELVIERFDGTRAFVLNSGVPIRDSDGRIIGSAVAILDISDRKHAEEALRKSHDELEKRVKERTRELAQTVDILEGEIRDRILAEKAAKTERKRFEDVLEMMPAYAILLTPDYRVAYANRTFRQWFGHDQGKPCYEFLFNRTRPCEDCQTYTALKTGKPHYWEWTGPNGNNYDIYDYPFTDTDGSPLIMEIGVDVTAHKKVQKAVRQGEERYRSLTVATSQIVWTTNAHGQVCGDMPSWRALTGQSAEEIQGWGWIDALHPDDRDRTAEIWTQSVRDKSLYQTEYRIRRQDGDYCYVSVRGVPIIEPDGSIREWIGTCTDITERKAAQEKQGVMNSLLELFAKKTLRKEYLDAVVKVIRDWSHCQCIGIRLINSDGCIPYESCVGFSDEFLALENMISLHKETCACVRVIAEMPDPQELPVITSKGSFRCANTLEFIRDLPEKDKARYRGQCPRCGFASVAVIPIRYREKVLGAIHLTDKQVNKISPEAVEFLENMAMLIGEALFRFETEISLRLSESRLLEAQQVAHLGNWELELDTNSLWWSDEVYRIFGLAPQQVMPTYDMFLSYVHPEDRNEVISTIERAMSEEVQYSIDHRVVRPDGFERVVHEQAEIVYDATRKPTRMVGIVHDITDRVRAEEAVRQSEQRFRLMAQASKDVFWMSTPGVGQMLYISPAYETLWGRTRKSLYRDPKTFLEAVHPEDRGKLIAGIQGHAEGRWDFEYRVLQADGSIRWVHDIGYPVRDERGELTLMAGMVRDITDRKKAEEDILAQQKELRSLTMQLQLAEERERRRIAQDIHDSIGQILSFSGNELKLLQRSVPEGIAESLRVITEQLDIAVEQARSLSFNLSPSLLYDLGLEVAIEDLADRISRERKMKCSFKNCSLEKPLTEDVKVLLYRGARELLINASKHAQATMVKISCVRSGSDIVIEVQDDGRGFDVSTLKDKTKTVRGFGLRNLHERLQYIGGSMKIESNAGAGTKVILTAPLNMEQNSQKEITREH